MLPDAAHRAARAVGCVGARVGGGCVRAPRVRARACSGTHVPRNDDVLARNDFVLGAVGGGASLLCMLLWASRYRMRLCGLFMYVQYVADYARVYV